MRRGQFKIEQLPIHKRRESNGGATMVASAFVGETTETAPVITFDSIVEASAELVNDTHILITLNTEQNQENDDANYELLNKIYDNFETETNFFKKIKLRFLSGDFDLDSVSGFTYNREVQLELKKYKTENDEWIEDEEADVLEYFLCFDIRDFGIDEYVASHNYAYNRALFVSGELQFDNSIFAYLSKNKEFYLDVYFRDTLTSTRPTIPPVTIERSRAFASSDIINSNKLVLFGEQIDGIDVNGAPTGLIELEYGFPLLLNYIRCEKQLNIVFDIKLKEPEIPTTSETTKLKIEYRTTGSNHVPALELTGIIEGKFSEVLFENNDLLKCQFIKENPNKLQIISNYNIESIVNKINNDIANIQTEIAGIIDIVNSIDIPDFTDAINDIISDIAGIKIQIQNIIEIELVSITNQISANYNTIIGIINNINTEITNINLEITNINLEITGIQNQIANINNNITILTNSIDPIAINGVWIMDVGINPSNLSFTNFAPNIVSPIDISGLVIPYNYVLVLEWRARFTRIIGDAFPPNLPVLLNRNYSYQTQGKYNIYQGTESDGKPSGYGDDYISSWTEYIKGAASGTAPQIWSFSHTGRYFISAMCHWKIVKIAV